MEEAFRSLAGYEGGLGAALYERGPGFGGPGFGGEGLHEDPPSRATLDTLFARETLLARPVDERDIARSTACLARLRYLNMRSCRPERGAFVLSAIGPGRPSGRGRPPRAGGLEALEAALDEHPSAEVAAYIPWNLAALAHRVRALSPRIRLVRDLSAARDLLPRVRRVYVVDSPLGFEALVLGTPVTCFGTPFYSGWGLTDDRVPVPDRPGPRSLEELFAIACIRHGRYLSPGSGRPCEIEEAIDHDVLQREAETRHAGTLYAFGFGPWKHGFVRAYLRGPKTRVRFCLGPWDAKLRGASSESKLLVWGLRDDEKLRAFSRRLGVPLWRMEDGFLRSVGLGSDFNVPASLVVDKQGIYFDPNQPSDLETILETHEFSGHELERARKLRETIVRMAISKYNFSASGKKLERPAGKRVLLVPGQVEDDASIRLGCVDIRTNRGLLEEVRRQNPDAHIIFKPHPDILSGNRKVGRFSVEEALRYADQVITDVPLPMCLDIADEVHTMTSLVGFEALLRGLRVVTYGRPFYAGWGLTEDRHRVERRTRKLSLDMLTAGALIRYPLYLSRTTGRLTTPEVVIEQLREELAVRGRSVRPGSRLRRVRKLVQAIKSLVNAT